MEQLPLDLPPREPFDPAKVPMPAPSTTPPVASGPITVSQLTALVRRAIDSALPATLQVIGEISNLKRHSSGHVYFTLKDRFSEIPAVLWRSDAVKVKFELRDGLEVILTGQVEVFEKAGRYQLHARRLEPRGTGALELAFRQLRDRLQREGLFDPARKKKLPRFPRRIAVVTSPTGAAVVDILRTIQRRFPCVDVLIYPVRVHGASAAQQIAAGIRELNAKAAELGGLDLIVVARGGGSLEDLWAFNEEIVARAIFASAIPIVSGVGHETDVTIADLVADVRAATPTAAAELTVPVLAEVLEGIMGLGLRIQQRFRQRLDVSEARFHGVCRHQSLVEPLALVRIREQRVDEATQRMHTGFRQRLHEAARRIQRIEQSLAAIMPHYRLIRASAQVARIERRLASGWAKRMATSRETLSQAQRRLERLSPRGKVAHARSRLEATVDCLHAAAPRHNRILENKLAALERLLEAVSYKKVLARGFSITLNKTTGTIIRSPVDVSAGQAIVTRLLDGQIESHVVQIKVHRDQSEPDRDHNKGERDDSE